jgi:lipopolysaccharide transport system permease protein
MISRNARPGWAAGVEYYRDLILSLLDAEFAVRYRNTVLGYAWSVLHPLMFTAVFLFAFKVVLKVQIENYTLFLVAGLFPWQAMQNSVCSGTGVFLNNASLIRRVRFPRHMLVVVGALNDLAHFVLSLPIIALVMILSGIWPRLEMVWAIPLLLIVQFCVTVGLSLIAATLNLFFRDLERLVTIAMMLLFYVTPIVYLEDLIPAHFGWCVYANPLATAIINWQHLWMGVPVNLVYLAVSAGWALAILALGYLLYGKLNWRFGELV